MQYSASGDHLPNTSGFNVSLAEGDADRARLLGVMKEQFVANKKHLDVSLDRLVEALKKLGKI